MSRIHVYLILFAAVLIWSAIAPYDRFTWLLEVMPAIMGAAILILTYRTFRFTDLAYLLITLHCNILMVGGHYTYAEVPLFDHIAELMGSSRNNYDKVGHFAQGFVPAMIAREVLIRKDVIASSNWRNVLIVALCLAISAFYEFIEWWVAVLSGTSGDAFLGSQGYVWDTQSDMFLAMIGAMTALLTLSRLHDRQLQSVAPPSSPHLPEL